MSIRVMNWALNEAPVEEPVQVLILVAMAEKCNDDGTETYQSAKTISEKARVSVRTVQRELKGLEAAGIISRGDQSHATHLPANRRPVVYDLAVHLSRYDKMTPQKSGTTPGHSDTTGTAPRYDIDDTSDTTQMADNQSLENVPTKQSSNTAPALFETPNAVAVVKASLPEQQIARRLYDDTRGALKYPAMMKIAEWAIKAYPERNWREIGNAMVSMKDANVTPTQIGLQRILDGKASPGRGPVRSTTNDRILQGLDIRSKYRAMEEQDQNHREENAS